MCVFHHDSLLGNFLIRMLRNLVILNCITINHVSDIGLTGQGLYKL